MGQKYANGKLQHLDDGSFRIGHEIDSGNYLELKEDGEVVLNGTAKVYKIDTFLFNYSRITGRGKPTLVDRGLAFGFSLPVYNTDDEELFSCKCIPDDWDGGNITGYVGGWLPSANNAKKFNLQFSWECWSPDGNEVVPTAVQDVPVETTTGNWDAYTSFKIPFAISISASGCSSGDIFALRIRRLAASEDEITGEIVVEGASIQYTIDKLGLAT